jgi:hypothetical protein
MAIDGLKEVQEAVMLIEAGLSTYEKECAKRGDDYQEILPSRYVKLWSVVLRVLNLRHGRLPL